MDSGRGKEMNKSSKVVSEDKSPYISPTELAERWRCARSSVDRIARRAGLTRLYLGVGNNGIVRYVKEEVVKYEASRQIVTR